MSPRIDRPNLFTRVSLPAGIDGAPGQRYELGAVLGTGATSAVYTAYDTNFARTVALKVIEGVVVSDPERLGDFINEARISAALEHPNIVPVYDMDRTSTGGVYLSMREIDGRSLAEAIDLICAGTPPAAVSSLNDRVQIILQIANAVACAHDRRIVHRDIKPANIMLGRFGEVFLVDWGTALQLPASGPAPASQLRVGTPFYMSPEQVRGGEIDERSDLYCLGATLFHLLWLRPPTTIDTTEHFWQRKELGLYDPPTAKEMPGIPRHLLAIAEKALAADPAQRYQHVVDFANDLRAFQAGLAVSAYREPWYERAERWHRTHARLLWPGMAMAVIVLLALAWQYNEHQKDLATWGEPVLSESLDEHWGERWSLEVVDNVNEGGGFALDRGALVSTGPAANYLFLRQRLAGSVALEFTGTMRPDAPEADLSVAWSIDNPFITIPDQRNRWLMQTGADDNAYAMLLDMDQWVRVDVTPIRLHPGQSYRMRAEIDGSHLRFSIDGRVVLQHDTDLPFTGGWIGLYGYYPGKEFRDIKLYAKGLPERVSVLALGDNDAQDGLYARAAEQYRRVVLAHPTSPLGQEARYRQGLMQRRVGDLAGATATWAGLHGSLANLAFIWQANDAIAIDDPRAALTVLKRASLDEQRARQHVALMWVQGVRRASGQEDHQLTEDYLAWQQTALAKEPLVQEEAALALITLDRATEALQRFPQQPRARARALMHLGRYEEVLSTCTRLHDLVEALMLLGRYRDILQRYPQVKWARDDALRRLGQSTTAIEDDLRLKVPPHDHYLLDVGRIDEVLANPKIDNDQRGRALLLAGRFSEALTVNGETRGWAHLALGNFREALNIPTGRISLGFAAQGCLFMQAVGQGDREGMRQARAALPLVSFDDNGRSWFARTLLVPVVDTLNGDPAALTKTLAALHPGQDQQRPEFALRYLSGLSDEASLALQPCVQDVPGISALLRAIRYELNGDPHAAVAAYNAWLAMPSWRRSIDSARYEPVSEWFVTWRLHALR